MTLYNVDRSRKDNDDVSVDNVIVCGDSKVLRGSLELTRTKMSGLINAGITKKNQWQIFSSFGGMIFGYWQREFAKTRMAWGMFGENFTTEGLMEDAVNIGDRFQIGSAKLVATQPRMPCYKLGVKFGRMNIIRQFLASGRPGIYFRVLEEGKVGAGDSIHLISRNTNNITINDIVQLYTRDKNNIEKMQRAARIKDLPAGWRFHFLERISEIDKSIGVNDSIAK